MFLFQFGGSEYIGLIDRIPIDKDKVRIYSKRFWFWIDKNLMSKSNYEEFIKFNNRGNE